MTADAELRIRDLIEQHTPARPGIAEAGRRQLTAITGRLSAIASESPGARSAAETAVLHARLQHLEAELKLLPVVSLQPRVTP